MLLADQDDPGWRLFPPASTLQFALDRGIEDSVCVQLRVYVNRIPRKHGSLPDNQAGTTQTVLEQAEGLSDG